MHQPSICSSYAFFICYSPLSCNPVPFPCVAGGALPRAAVPTTAAPGTPKYRTTRHRQSASLHRIQLYVDADSPLCACQWEERLPLFKLINQGAAHAPHEKTCRAAAAPADRSVTTSPAAAAAPFVQRTFKTRCVRSFPSFLKRCNPYLAPQPLITATSATFPQPPKPFSPRTRPPPAHRFVHSAC